MDNLQKNPITSHLDLSVPMFSSSNRNPDPPFEENLFLDGQPKPKLSFGLTRDSEFKESFGEQKQDVEKPLSTSSQIFVSQDIKIQKYTMGPNDLHSQQAPESTSQHTIESQFINLQSEEAPQNSELSSARESIFHVQENEAVLSNETEEENSRQEFDEHQMKKLIKEMGKIKAEVYLRHSMAFFLATLFMARYSLELIENSSCLKEILIVLYGYLCYAFLEEINFYFKFKTTDNDTKISYIYAGLDVFSLICSLILLHLKFLKILPPGKVASLPGLVICTLFYFSSYRRKSAKNLFLLKRFLEAVQIYFIEAKADGRLDLSWRTILLYTSIYIGVRILLLVASLKTVKVLLPHNSKKANVLLSLWHCLYIALFLVMLIIYITYSQAIDTNGNFEALKTCLISVQYFSALLVCYTLFTKPFLLMAFSRASSLDYQSNEFGEVILDPLSIGISKKIKVEMLETYFSKISSTYYQHLQKRITTSKIKFNELELKIIYDRATKELRSAYLYLTQSLKENTIIRGPVEKDCENIKIKQSNFNTNQNKTKLAKLLFPKREKVSATKQSKKKDKQKTKEKEEEEDNVCFVCLKEAANGIIIECGHSGFCYECAEKYLMMKSQCMSCRGDAERIAKIKMKPIFERVYKSCMVGKLVLAVDDDRCQWIFD